PRAAGERDPSIPHALGGHPPARRSVSADPVDAAGPRGPRHLAPVDAMSRTRDGQPARAGVPATPRGRVALLGVALLAVAILGWVLGLHEWVRPEGLARLRLAIEAYGPWGPVLYVAGYVVAELLFLPALPLPLLGGLMFGPVRGTVYTWMAATLAAALAFFVARYLLRDTVERWMDASPRLRRIDAAVERHGWRILMITRLVPLFPFNL